MHRYTLFEIHWPHSANEHRERIKHPRDGEDRGRDNEHISNSEEDEKKNTSDIPARTDVSTLKYK